MSTATITPSTTPIEVDPAYALEVEGPADVVLVAFHAQLVQLQRMEVRTAEEDAILRDLPTVIRRVAELADRALCAFCEVNPNAARQDCCGDHVCEGDQGEHDQNCAELEAQLREEGDVR